MRLLVVEDDDGVAAPLTDGLRREGFAVDRFRAGAAALEALDRAEPDLVLLDLGLPDVDGFDVCRRIRATSHVPVIIITARDDEFDRVIGLELGADDYVVKPFGFRELVARIRAVLRRTSSPSDAGAAPGEARVIEGPRGTLVVDERTHRVLVDDTPLDLTPKEHDLLILLAEDPGRVCTRTEIIERVWDPHWYGPTKTLDVHIASLRRKLGDPEWIETVRSVGYRLAVG